MTHSSNIAVLTGDLVHSTDLGNAKIARAIAALEECARVQEHWHGAPLHFTRHRGDGWQVVLASPELALRSALGFRAALRANGEEFDSYMGIAAGFVTNPVGPDLNDETGDVFVASGAQLETLKASKHAHRILLSGAHDAAARLADHISQGWTAPQAAAIQLFLAPGAAQSYTEVAKTLGISRQAVAKSTEAAGLHPLRYALKSIEETSDA